MSAILEAKVVNQHEQRARKALLKLGLVDFQGVTRVTLKIQNQIYAISQPAVVHVPGSETFIVFGEPKVDDLMQRLQQAQSQNAFNPQDFQMPEAAMQQAAAAAEEEEEEGVAEEIGDLDVEEIESIVSQTGASRNKAIRALRSTGTVVDAILELSQ
jgi:nascent polypeptide-associated complex subunit alpha